MPALCKDESRARGAGEVGRKTSKGQCRGRQMIPRRTVGLWQGAVEKVPMAKGCEYGDRPGSQDLVG